MEGLQGSPRVALEVPAKGRRLVSHVAADETRVMRTRWAFWPGTSRAASSLNRQIGPFTGRDPKRQRGSS